MDAGYDALEEAALSFAKTRERGDDEGRSHRSSNRDRDRDHDRDRERRHRDRGDEREDRHRDRGDRDRERDRDRDGHRDRDRDRERERADRYERGGGYDERPRRRRREDDDYGIAAEPMSAGGPPGGNGGGGRDNGHRDRRPRYDDGRDFAQPMRGFSPPRRRRDDDGGDWRGGGGGGRGRREGGGGGRDGGRRDDRRGGFSPGGRSPTPPGTVPLEERHVQNSHWDQRPPQFEGVGAMEAKMTGMFTYGPGRVPPPLHLGVPPSLVAGSFPPSNPVRQTKRLYIGGINESITEQQIQDFFNKLMHENKLAVDMPGEPVAQCQINNEKSFAFVEFRTPEEATAALQFDGVMYEGSPLRVRRPKDYAGIDPLMSTFGGSIAPSVADSPNKLFVGGLPTYLNDEQVMELLKSFGELKSFNLVKESAGVSKGFAFCEYLDPTVTDMAIQGLHNFALGDRNLVVQRAAVGRNQAGSSAMPGSAAFLSQAVPHILQANADAPTSRVMLLLNMVTPEELVRDDDYADILEDINEECGKYGEVEGVRIPRPTPKSKKWEPSDSAAATAEKNRKADEEAGVGRVYVMYKDIESTKKAMKAIGGRQFAGRTILVANVSEEEFLGPAPPPPPPPEPEDLDAAAADAVKDIMSGLMD
ncbi:hypothetical protein IAR55_006923 [Kwoniella newhampshirensis]|uniref:RRM domain-containing protein n=1 Tax=Kwoniella newhampshirensis TaxID=1651941 RepID=A0AAW0YTT3_9TREE